VSRVFHFYLLPFYRETACFFSDEIRSIFPFTTYIEGDGFFDENGKFLNRIKLPKGLDLNFLNSDLFYGWVWTPEGKQQVLIDKNGKILKTFFSVPNDKFSINAADKTGRLVMFNYFAEEYTPFLLSHQCNGHAAIGVTDKYEIILIDKNGKILNKISRDIPPGIINAEEKEYFKRQITGSNTLPDFAKKKFLKISRNQ